MTTYHIIRFHFDSRTPNEIIVEGLTLEQAQAHCQRPDTRGGSTEAGNAWFDGYEEDPG